VRRLDDELVVYDRQRDTVHNLNPTAAAVWNLCDGERPTAAIVSELAGRLGIASVEATTLVEMSLERLGRAQLLVAEDHEGDNRLWQGPSRREALRSLAGIAALLPVVFSLVAPHPVAAQSGPVTCGQFCHQSQGIFCPPGCRCDKPRGAGVCIPA